MFRSRNKRHTYSMLLLLSITMLLINMLILHRPKVRNKLKTLTSSLEYLEKNLEAEIAADDWTECEFPGLDIFNPKLVEYEQSNVGPPMEVCPSTDDWVDCTENKHQTFCGINKKATSLYKNVVCTMYCVQSYGDTDDMITLSKLSTLKTANLRYSLGNSDIAKFECTAIGNKDNVSYQWNGTKIGFRKFDYPVVKPTTEKNFEPNILILALGSMSTNGFIRQMPKSYKTLADELESVFLNGYSMIETNRDATILALLTGKTELELPELRKRMSYQSAFVDDDILFLIDKLKSNGYRTMFVEDLDDITGTFMERLSGYVTQPTHHFFYMYNSTDNMKGNCYGDTLRHSFVINLTNRFFKLKGKKFGFALISGKSTNKSATYRWSDVDEELSQFLHNLFKDGVLNNTMLFVLSDQGARFPENDPDLYQGHIERRLPLMTVRLPDDMLALYADKALNANSESITTPFDVYRTILHLVDLDKKTTESYPNKTIAGARFRRGMTLLNRIPRSRSCAEAGVQPYWCVCLKRKILSPNDVMYYRVPQEFVVALNKLREVERLEMEPIELALVEYVMKKSFHDQLSKYNGSDIDGYLPIFQNKTADISYYHFKVILDTGIEVYEVSVPYLAASDQLLFSKSTVSATN